MTKIEITKKSNSYKIKLNTCNQRIDNYDRSITSFSRFKTYLTQSNLKAKKHKKLALTYACVSGAIAIACSFVALPITFILLVTSVFAFERFAFFTKVAKKFEHCVNYLSNVISHLSTKQYDYVTQRDYALEQIIKLENTIPEVIAKYLDTNDNSALETNLDVLSL